MKKFICIFLAIVTFCIFPLNTLAANIQITESNMIDDLFAQLDSLALEKKILLSQYDIDFETYQQISQANYNSSAQSLSQYNYPQELYTTLDRISNEKSDIETILFRLGIEKITEDNLHYLEELNWLGSDIENLETQSTPPTLDTFNNAYSIYIYDGNYNYGGQNNQYRYIRVVDDKNYNGLSRYINHTFVGILFNHASFIEAMGSTVEYLVSSLIASIPYIGTGIDYTISTLASTFDIADSTYYALHPVYKMDVSTVTTMTYFYINDSSWKLIGSSADFTVLETHMLRYKSGSTPVHDNVNKSFRGSTGWSWYDYIEYYVDNKQYTNNPQIFHEIGSYKYQGPYNSLVVTPRFAEVPGELLSIGW